jgi:uncharacterized protein
MSHLIIDGYNYISRTRASGLGGNANFESVRRLLLDKLARYKKERGLRITVVFDAYRSFSLGRQRENFKGIDVVYSKEGETADDVIIGWAREKRAGMVVVTSDRAIMDEAKENGIAFITPLKLEELMGEMVKPGAVRKDEGEEETGQPVKKGNPRKLPKKLRKAVKRIGKI